MSGRQRAPSAREQLYESLRECLRKTGAGRGPWSKPEGDAAIEQIAQAVEIALRHRLAGLDVREVIGWAASAMAVSVDERHRAHTAPRQSLATAKAAQQIPRTRPRAKSSWSWPHAYRSGKAG